MRRAIALAMLCVGGWALAAPYQPPPLNGMVADPGGVLTADQESQLAKRLDDFRLESGFAVAVFFPTSLEGQT